MARRPLAGDGSRDGADAMRTVARNGVLIVVTCVLLFAAWRLIGQMQAEHNAVDNPDAALSWRPSDPVALLQLTEQQRAKQKLSAAAQTARQLLVHEPLSGQAFRELGLISDQHGDQARAKVLFDIAARRAPRDLPTHAWLAQYALQQHDYAAAMGQFDIVFRQAPERIAKLAPALAQMAQTPAFADALAARLRTNPPWRAAILQALQAPADRIAQTQVMQSLQASGGLSADEFGRWLNSLMAQGRWGEAYARWAGTIIKSGGRLPILFNGDFNTAPSSAGFDWYLRDVPGVLVNVAQQAEVPNRQVHLSFMDRGIPSAGLEHPLLLMPGRYRLHMQARGQALTSALGLQWVIDCQPGPRLVVLSLPADGSFSWRQMTGDFEIPSKNCQGQWLRLINPVSGGAGQRVAGALWLADMRIDRLPDGQAPD